MLEILQLIQFFSVLFDINMKEKVEDDPPHSRVFILHSRDTKQEDLETAFQKFGTIENITRLKDKHTGENKGVSYIKYSKMSEAAAAVEGMNGVPLDAQSRPLKVVIANSREEGSKRDDSGEKLLRLFIVVPKDGSVCEQELRDYFQQFGEVDYVFLLKDKESNKNKGFAYVKYYKISDTAKALEEADKKYKPILARPKEKSGDEGGYNRPGKDYGRRRNDVDDYNEGGLTRVSAYISSQLTENQALRLFDIMPGLEFGKLTNEVSYCTRQIVLEYSSPETAEYAVSKLNGFEYPVGEPIMAKLDYDWGKYDMAPRSKRDQRGFTVGPDSIFKRPIEKNCSAILPPVHPLVTNSEGKYRLFFVCKPEAPPVQVLRNVFCRFENLTDCYLLPHRNCGYISYATEESANNTKVTLHDQELFGSVLKVVDADPPPARNEGAKRPRYN